MIVVDTNVVSELMRGAPSPTVVSWLNRQDASKIFLTSISLAEIQFGLRVLPGGQRRIKLYQGLERLIARAFAGRILGFEENAAELYGEIMAQRRAMGRPLGILDGQIAAIARTQGFAVATRNVRDFVDCGLEVIDPFDPQILEIGAP